MLFAAHEMPLASIMLPEILTEGWDVTAKNRILSVDTLNLLLLSRVNEISAELGVREVTWYFAAMEGNVKINWIIKNIRKYCLMLLLSLFDIKITDIN